MDKEDKQTQLMRLRNERSELSMQIVQLEQDPESFVSSIDSLQFSCGSALRKHCSLVLGQNCNKTLKRGKGGGGNTVVMCCAHDRCTFKLKMMRGREKGSNPYYSVNQETLCLTHQILSEDGTIMTCPGQYKQTKKDILASQVFLAQVANEALFPTKRKNGIIECTRNMLEHCNTEGHMGPSANAVKSARAELKIMRLKSNLGTINLSVWPCFFLTVYKPCRSVLTSLVWTARICQVLN